MSRRFAIAPVPAGAAAAQAIRVLLVQEDAEEAARVRVLLGMIADPRFEIDWCPTVAAARALLRRRAHDVCLVDYRLGGQNGLDLLREARAAGSDIPLIILSSEDDREIDLQAMRTGAAYYLAKAGLAASVLERTIRYAFHLRGAEQRACASEARVRAILDHAVDGIITIDEHGVIESFNPAASRLFGYTPQEMVGVNVSVLMTDADRGAHDRHLAAYRATGVSHIIGRGREVLGRRKDGSTVPIEIAVSEMVSDGVRTFIGTLRDMSERKRAEAALRESEQRLQLSIEAAGIGLWDWDIAGGTVYYSPQWKAQLGYAADELGADTHVWEQLLHPDDRAPCIARLRRDLEQSRGPYEDEFRLRHRDGSYRWLHTRAAIHRDPSGKAVRMIGAHVDITERRASEETARQLNAELERRVAERTEQLAAANRELEAFNYSVSHDLRAPLRAIDGFAQALAEEYGAGLPQSARHYLERVRLGAHRMSELIDDLLQLARVARDELRRQRVDLSRLAREIADDLRQKAPERVVELEIQPGLLAECDATLLRQALENLLGNAWKYTSRHPRARIAFGAERRDGGLTYFVRDDGAGFDSEYADKLFRPFQRLHTSAEFEGTGIGLATVRRIVQRHGGRVWAEGAIEGGATFFFTLGT